MTDTALIARQPAKIAAPVLAADLATNLPADLVTDLVASPPMAPLAMPKQALEHPRGALLGGMLALLGRRSTRSSQG